MNLSDEELQKHIEQGKVTDNFLPEDIKIYQHLFNALQKEPGYRSSLNLEDKVMNKVRMKIERKLYVRDMFWFCIGIALMIITFVITLYHANFDIKLNFVNSLKALPKPVIFAVLVIPFLPLLDQWIKKRMINPVVNDE